MPLILAIDQGTTATKVLALDEDRSILARASQPTPLERPQPGWAENDPEGVLEATRKAIHEVIDQVEVDEIEAIGITNQRETTVAWQAGTGRPLGPAVSWQCRRTADLCQQLSEDAGTVDLVRDKTGLVIDPYFSATKMRWLLDNVKAVERAEQAGELLFGTIDAFLIHALTGQHATDVSNASRTMLYDIHAGAWSGDLISLLQLPPEALPEVKPSSGTFGQVASDATLGSEIPELQGVPVTGVAGDQQASLFGHGCLNPGEAKGTLGTGAFFLVNTGHEALPAEQGILTTVAWDLGDGAVYALEGAAFACGSVLEWASEVGLLSKPEALDAEAGSVDTADGVVFVPGLYGLAAPDWDPDAKGALFGLTASTEPAHLARAIAEGLSAQNARLLDALAEGGQDVDEVRLDGGVSRSDLLCQLLADATGTPVHRAHESELTALGAAGLAGLAVGIWDLADLAPGSGDVFDPEGPAGFLKAYEEAVETVQRR